MSTNPEQDLPEPITIPQILIEFIDNHQDYIAESQDHSPYYSGHEDGEGWDERFQRTITTITNPETGVKVTIINSVHGHELAFPTEQYPQGIAWDENTRQFEVIIDRKQIFDPHLEMLHNQLVSLIKPSETQNPFHRVL